MNPLTFANTGETITIKKISGNSAIRRHIAELGLVVGECIKVINNSGGNMIIQIKESRIAMDISMARRIFF